MFLMQVHLPESSGPKHSRGKKNCTAWLWEEFQMPSLAPSQLTRTGQKVLLSTITGRGGVSLKMEDCF